MREINNRLELSEASAALVAIPRGNSTANFDIKKTLFARSSRHSSAFAVLGKTHTVLTVIFPVLRLTTLADSCFTLSELAQSRTQRRS